MAQRRMFNKSVTQSDAFLDMPSTSQNLYFHLNMDADDDGFVNSPLKIMRIVGAAKNDMEILLNKKFILQLDDGIMVIKHWRLHNYIRKDRYIETNYKELKNQLYVDDNGTYTTDSVTGQPLVDHRLTQDSIGKDSIGKDSISIADNSSNNSLIDFVIDYLNEKAKRKFSKKTKSYRESINARINDGASKEDFIHVIDIKTEQWLGKLEFEKNLNPITLFRPSNFDRYLNERSRNEISNGTNKDAPDVGTYL